MRVWPSRTSASYSRSMGRPTSTACRCPSLHRSCGQSLWGSECWRWSGWIGTRRVPRQRSSWKRRHRGGCRCQLTLQTRRTKTRRMSKTKCGCLLQASRCQHWGPALGLVHRDSWGQATPTRLGLPAWAKVMNARSSSLTSIVIKGKRPMMIAWRGKCRHDLSRSLKKPLRVKTWAFVRLDAR